MRINTQFPMAVHILAVLSYFGGKTALTSEALAKSVGTNPVVVRRIVSRLKKAGLVDARPGVPGATLRRRPDAITLLDVYNAVRAPGDTLFDLHKNPSMQCPVGAHIADAVEGPLGDAQRAMEHELSTRTLAEVTNTIIEQNSRADG